MLKEVREVPLCVAVLEEARTRGSIACCSSALRSSSTGRRSRLPPDTGSLCNCSRRTLHETRGMHNSATCPAAGGSGRQAERSRFSRTPSNRASRASRSTRGLRSACTASSTSRASSTRAGTAVRGLGQHYESWGDATRAGAAVRETRSALQEQWQQYESTGSSTRAGAAVRELGRRYESRDGAT